MALGSWISDDYSRRLVELYTAQIETPNPNPYEPTESCYSVFAMQAGYWNCTPSTDVSVSAFMEIACHTANNSWLVRLRGAGKAAAIDKDNVDNEHYYYWLDTPDETALSQGYKLRYQIYRDDKFSVQP